MIRLINKKLIIPRGDTGSFSLPALTSLSEGDKAIFSIIDTKTNKIIFPKECTYENDILTVEFTHYETVNLPVGKYYWDVKIYQGAEIVDNQIVNGIEVDSYYAAYQLPVCQIRQTGDKLLIADNAPTGILSSEALDILTATINEITDIKHQAKKEAQAWAIGKRNGVDVDSSDPTYHNNSKYYADQANVNASIAVETIQNATTQAITSIQNASTQQIEVIQTSAEQVIDTVEENVETILNNTAQTITDATAAMNGIEAQKNTMIASIAAIAEMGTDTTFTQSGVAADAKAVGNLKSAFINESLPDIIETVKHPATTNTYIRSFNQYVSNDNIPGNYIYMPFSSSATAAAYSLSDIDAWSKDIVLENGHRYELIVDGVGTYETVGTGDANASVHVCAANVSTDYGLVAGYNLIGEPYSSTLKRHLNKTFVYNSTMGNIMVFLCFGCFKGTNYNISITIKDTSEDNRIITVGVGKQYTSFTDAIKAVSDNANPKTIYVYPGIYDIFAEYGGANYISSLSVAGLSWTDVSAIVPPNTRIVGIGDVTLKWTPTDTEIIDQAHAFLFSPLNVRGNCEIENIKISCSNCRYGIHDETGGLEQFDGAVHVFKNVTVVYTGSTYGVKYAYGAGHNKNMKFQFENCFFSAANGSVWSTHDWPASQYENSDFVFNNCIFINTAQNLRGSVRFSSSDTVGRIDNVQFNNCSLRNISFSSEGNTTVKQGYAVTLIGCNTVGSVYADSIDTNSRVEPTQYNAISVD